MRLPKEVPSANLVPYLKPLDILFEDDYIIIVFKPNGQNCAPSREHPHESLVEQVLGYLQDKGENTNPHIVTRLDRNTTGIVLFAKYGYIHYLFSKINMNKKYICLAHGLTKSSDVIGSRPFQELVIVLLKDKYQKMVSMLKPYIRRLNKRVM